MLLVSDLDGTLLDSRHRVSRENQQAVQRLAAAGGQFAIATGRSLMAARRFAPPLGVRYLVLCGGAVLYDMAAEDFLAVHTLADEAYALAQEIQEGVLQVGLQVFGPRDVYTLRDHAIFAQKAVQEEYSGLETPMAAIPKGWCKLMLVGEEDALQVAKGHIGRQYPNLRAFSSGRHFCEVCPKGADKGTGLVELLHACGVPADDVAAVGDSENDLPMLRQAALPMAVGNAMPAVCRQAKVVLPPHNEHPMAAAVEEIFRAGRQMALP